MKVIACMVLMISLCCCNRSTPTKLGSLNEAGIPDEQLARLQGRMTGNISDVKTQQAVERIQIGIDKQQHLFYITNDSSYFLDQLSFGCDFGDKQYVYFTWNVGVIGAYPEGEIQWVKPGTSHRTFPSSADTEYVILLHNSGVPDETLHSSQVSWLLQKYDFHDCRPLDVADATDQDPTIITATPPDQAAKAGAVALRSACRDAESILEMCKANGVVLPNEYYASYRGYSVPLPELPRTTFGRGSEADKRQICNVATEWQNYCHTTAH